MGIGSPGLLEIKAIIRKAFGQELQPGKLTLRKLPRFHRKAVRLIKNLRGDAEDPEEDMEAMATGV